MYLDQVVRSFSFLSIKMKIGYFKGTGSMKIVTFPILPETNN